MRDVLWVADSDNFRVLKFANVSLKTNGSSADAMFGTGTKGCSSTAFSHVFSVVGDALDNLYVADSDNNRVLRFISASTKSTGAAANFALGATSVSSCGSGNATQSTFNAPSGLALDTMGTLYVSDSKNNRVMGFFNASTFNTNGPSANVQIGQQNFTTAAARSVSSTSLNFPQAMAYDNISSYSLLVASYLEN